MEGFVKQLSENALAMYRKLYFNNNETKPQQVHERVAKAISKNKDEYSQFLKLLNDNSFRPNSPCMINAKVKKSDKPYDNNLAACYVIGLEDSMDSIMYMWSICGKVYAGGGGVGIPLSNLREKGSPISTGGLASGPISYLKVVQAISDSVKSGGKSRRAANLTSFKYNHPDILDYIKCKEDNELSAVNISVLVSDHFMKLVDEGKWDTKIELVSPHKDTVVGSLTVKEIWEPLIEHAWKSGDPGLLFYNESNRRNAFPSKGEILATNPCLPAWAPVLTDQGYKLFKDVDKFKVRINNSSTDHSELVKTSDSALVYQVTLQSGINLYVTSNHKISTPNGDIELEKLKIGDIVNVDYSCDLDSITFDNKLFTEGYTDGLDFKEGRLEESKFVLRIFKKSWSYQFGAVIYLIDHNCEFSKQALKIKDLSLPVLEAIQLILSSVNVYSRLIETEKLLNIYDVMALNKLLVKCDLNDVANKINSEVTEYNLNVLHQKKKQYITDIKQLEAEAVYDINVPEGNHFVSSGVIVHNCGEVTLPDFSMCNLGSINLVNCIDEKKKSFDFAKFKEYIKVAHTFLDNVIDTTSYPTEEFHNRMTSDRPVGLGIMGFSWVLYKLGIRYGSKESLKLFEDICKTLTVTSIETSIDRAEQLGKIEVPSEDEKHFIDRLKYYGVSPYYINKYKKTGIRNSTWTSIAPTGSISISADSSYAFEPEMALIWSKYMKDDDITLYFTNQIFEEACKEHGVELTDEIRQQISNNRGSCQGIDAIPKELQEYFVTAFDVGWKDKIEMQKAGQRYISLAISSTCNLPKSATKEDISEAYLLAWKSKLKGITVYRDGSLEFQPVNFGASTEEKTDSPCTGDKMIRPMARLGTTVEIKTPHGTLYLTGNVDKEGRLFEVFLNMGEQGQLTNILLNALGRIISKALQFYVPTSEIVDTLSNCGGLSFFMKLSDNGEHYQAASIIDAIAKILEVYFQNNVNAGAVPEPVIEEHIGEKCPECGKFTLTHTSGCRGGSCKNCGYSACQ